MSPPGFSRDAKRTKRVSAMKNLTIGMVLGAAALFGAGAARADDPLMGKAPWNFTPQNRAGIAVAMKNIEDPNSGGSGGGSGTTIVCGGTSGAGGTGGTGSGSSATANSNCVIINNSDGAIVNTDQHSNGDQTSSSSAHSTTKTGSIDDVSAILNGNKQGL